LNRFDGSEARAKLEGDLLERALALSLVFRSLSLLNGTAPARRSRSTFRFPQCLIWTSVIKEDLDEVWSYINPADASTVGTWVCRQVTELLASVIVRSGLKKQSTV